MARAFKEITGNITKLNDPYFAEQRGLWMMMVKVNDRWIAINSRDEGKIRDYHRLLETRKSTQTLNITVQPTTLSQEKVKMAEYAFGNESAWIQSGGEGGRSEICLQKASRVLVDCKRNCPRSKIDCNAYATIKETSQSSVALPLSGSLQSGPVR